MTNKLQPRVSRLRIAALTVFALLLLPVSAQAQQEPIRIGFGMALTGGLAANGKSALVAMQIWESDINAKGGMLGRPVKLVFYDDQSKTRCSWGSWAWRSTRPSTTPSISR